MKSVKMRGEVFLALTAKVKKEDGDKKTVPPERPRGESSGGVFVGVGAL